LIIILVLTGFPASLFSQKLNIVLEPGIGSYGMKDLKELNKLNLSSLPFDAKATSNFPAYWYNKLSLEYSMKKLLTVGFTFSYQSTGSRISRVDYSGEYYFDNRIRALSPGVTAEIYFHLNSFLISIRNEAGIEFTKLRLNEYLRINTESTNDKFSFISQNWYYEPTVKVSYPISFFRLGLVAGWLFDLKKEILAGSDSNTRDKNIVLSSGSKATADWSGIRLGISLSFNLL
jgi:hypothetical protein